MYPPIVLKRFFGEPVINNKTPIEHVKIIESDIGDETHPIRQDSNKLTKNIIKLYENNKYNISWYNLYYVGEKRWKKQIIY